MRLEACTHAIALVAIALVGELIAVAGGLARCIDSVGASEVVLSLRGEAALAVGRAALDVREEAHKVDVMALLCK